MGNYKLKAFDSGGTYICLTDLHGTLYIFFQQHLTYLVQAPTTAPKEETNSSKKEKSSATGKTFLLFSFVSVLYKSCWVRVQVRLELLSLLIAKKRRPQVFDVFSMVRSSVLSKLCEIQKDCPKG